MVICKLNGFILVLCLTLPLAAQSTRPVNRREFRDTSTGVTYQYPEDWKQVSGNAFYLFPAFLPDQAAIRNGLLWSPSGILKSTNISGAEFLFALQPGTSAHDCMHPVAPHASGTHVNSVTLNDIKYAHNWSGTGGLCHGMKEDIYATYRNHACYLFDLSVHTICSGAVDGMRNATKKELTDINAQLMSILETVRIDQRAEITTH
jgi:hypothetical protein